MVWEILIVSILDMMKVSVVFESLLIFQLILQQIINQRSIQDF